VRSHVIFARSEVRVSVYNNKNTLLKQQFVTGVDENNSLDPQPFNSMGPTGFSADIEGKKLQPNELNQTFSKKSSPFPGGLQ
jgi:hypothetical protein